MSRWMVFGLLALLVGCEDAAPEPTPTPPVVSAPKPVREVVDRSEAPAWYVGRGVPPLERRWKSEDWAKAVAVLETVAELEVEKLPRHQGAGAPLFRKLTDTKPLGGSAASSSEGIRRLLELSGYGEPLAVLTQLYARRDAKGAGFPAERARVAVTSLDYVALLAAPLAGAKAPEDAKQRQQFEAALAGVRTGVTRTVTDALLSLSADDFADEERRLIAAALERAIGQSEALLPPTAQRPLRERLELAASQSGDEATKARLLAARDKLTRAATSAER